MTDGAGRTIQSSGRKPSPRTLDARDGIGCSDLRAVIRRRSAQRRTCGGAVPLAAAQGDRVKIKRQGSITLGGSEKIAQRLVGIAQSAEQATYNRQMQVQVLMPAPWGKPKRLSSCQAVISAPQRSAETATTPPKTRCATGEIKGDALAGGKFAIVCQQYAAVAQWGERW